MLGKRSPRWNANDVIELGRDGPPRFGTALRRGSPLVQRGSDRCVGDRRGQANPGRGRRHYRGVRELGPFRPNHAPRPPLSSRNRKTDRATANMGLGFGRVGADRLPSPATSSGLSMQEPKECGAAILRSPGHHGPDRTLGQGCSCPNLPLDRPSDLADSSSRCCALSGPNSSPYAMNCTLISTNSPPV